jgi:diguanylate cyclase (GGDEF)-like protein
VWAAGVVVLAAVVWLVAWLARALDRARRETAEARLRLQDVEKQLALDRRDHQLVGAESRFYASFLNTLPHLARDLHTGVGERRMPAVLLNIVMRTLEPSWALVLVRRRRSLTEPGRENFLIVAAASEGAVKTGTQIPFGQGELGFVAEVQRTMTRQDFEAQTPLTRKRLREQNLHGVVPEIVAPMTFGDETVGVLALGPMPHDPVVARNGLRLVAQIGALALHDVTAYTEMKVTADVDGLTMVFNKRHMTRVLAEAIVKAQQDISCVSVFLFDIDNFKHYNDTNGHVAGDRLLQLLARLVQENTRRENVFGRFGGEEFLVVLPGVKAAHALAAAENIRSRIASHPFPFAEGQPLGCISVSGGVAEFPSDARDSTRLLQAADHALYIAKHAGRNRVLRAESHDVGGAEPLQPVGENRRALEEAAPPPAPLSESEAAVSDDVLELVDEEDGV